MQQRMMGSRIIGNYRAGKPPFIWLERPTHDGSRPGRSYVLVIPNILLAWIFHYTEYKMFLLIPDCILCNC